MSFTVYIDESGEAGISKVRDESNPGASPYFVLGAVVCQPTAEVHAANAMDQIRQAIKRKSWAHATDLNHHEKVFLAREISRLPVRYFATISFKKTLSGYKGQISGNAQKYYNKCVVYLLESIFSYLAAHLVAGADVRIIFERRNHDYDAMLRYLQKVKNNPIYPQSKVLKHLNPFSISSKLKGEDPMLDIADFVAHAVYQCTNRTPQNFGIPEPRYFRRLAQGLRVTLPVECLAWA